MPPTATDLLTRWSQWLGNRATDRQIGEMVNRWQRGIEPPEEPFYPEWPKKKEKTET